MFIRIPSRHLGIAALLWNTFAGASALAVPVADMPLPPGCESARHRASVAPAGKAPEPAFPAPQLRISTPVEPALFPSGERNYLIYELHLQSFTSDALTLRGIDVIDADGTTDTPITEFKDALLSAVLNAPGIDSGSDKRTRLEARQGVVAFLCLAFDADAKVPGKLRHRVHLDSSAVDGPVVSTLRTTLPVLGRPLAGTGWAPRNGPHIGSHHRMGLWVTDGRAQISRRFAIDWRIFKDGAIFTGDARDVRSYFAHGKQVLSVANGTVVFAKDGFPDNIPRTAAGFETAIPITMESVAGNTVVIKLSNGQFASYSHLQPGSVRVKTGDRVKRGQLLAKVGNSGDSRWPHLHFQVTTTPEIMNSEGVPFVIDRFRMKLVDGDWETRTREFPWGEAVAIDFGPETNETQK